MDIVLSNGEKNKLIETLNGLLADQRIVDTDNETSVQLDISIRSLIETLKAKDVDYLYAAEHVTQIADIYYSLEDYEHALVTCEIAFDYYRNYEEISGEITVGRTHTYWNYYCLLKRCNRDRETLISANRETKARVEKYYNEDDDQRKSLIGELDDDRVRYELGDGEITFFGTLKSIIKKHKRFFVIYFSIAAILFAANIAFYSVANNSIYTAIKMYLYDGSSVINRYTELEIKNSNYNKGEQFRQGNMHSDAIPFFEKALSELQNEFTEDSLIIAQTRMHLGVSYLSVDKLADAHEQFSNAYVAYKNSLGDDNDNTNEARMYWAVTNQAAGEYETAIKDVMDAFERMKYFGTKQEASYYLSEFFNKKGDYNLAIEWNDRFLKYFDVVAGRFGNTVYVRKANGEILRARILFNARELEGSEACFLSALEDLGNGEKAPGKKDLTMAINQLRFRTYQGLSEVKRGLGDDDGAFEMLVKAIECYDNVGNNDYDTLYLSSVEAYENNSRDLPQILLRNLEQTIAINGENNEYTVRQLGILSEYYLRKKDYNEAIAVNERALAIQKNLLAEEMPQSLSIYSSLAACYLGIQNYEQAENWALKGLKISTGIYGYKAQRTKLYITQLIACMNQTQRYENALTIIEICILVGIPESKSTLSSWKEYERKYIKKNDNEENVDLCKKNAEKLSETINEENFCSVIETVIRK